MNFAFHLAQHHRVGSGASPLLCAEIRHLARSQQGTGVEPIDRALSEAGLRPDWYNVHGTYLYYAKVPDIRRTRHILRIEARQCGMVYEELPKQKIQGQRVRPETLRSLCGTWGAFVRPDGPWNEDPLPGEALVLWPDREFLYGDEPSDETEGHWDIDRGKLVLSYRRPDWRPRDLFRLSWTSGQPYLTAMPPAADSNVYWRRIGPSTHVPPSNAGGASAK